MTILSGALSLLGVNEKLPKSHTARAAHRASRREAIDQKLEADKMALQSKMTAAKAEARDADAALTAAEAAHVAKVDVEIGESLYALLAAPVRKFRVEPNRTAARDICAVMLQHETRAREELGRGLSVYVLLVAFSAAVLEESPNTIGALTALDSSSHPALFGMFALSGTHSATFHDVHGSAINGRVEKLVLDLPSLERYIAGYCETHACASDGAAAERWGVQTSSATYDASRARWFALVNPQGEPVAAMSGGGRFVRGAESGYDDSRATRVRG